MASFFSKVFGRKKDEPTAAHQRRQSASASLLEGKYEAVSPTASPTADKFRNELTQRQDKEKEKDGGFSLFRPRSRSTAASPSDSTKSPSLTPHLELNLTVVKEPKSRALGVVFEAADDRGTLPDGVITERRLSSSEAVLLVKACAEAIIERGGEFSSVSHMRESASRKPAQHFGMSPIRPGNVGRHASALVLSVSGGPTTTNFTLYPFFGSQ